MSPKNTSDFILLSRLIQNLKNEEYYQTFAKTLLMTNSPETEIPLTENLVKEMFRYFIEKENLQIYHKGSTTSLEKIKEVAHQRTLNKNKSSNEEDLIYESIWENEIYIKTQELKKLYANRCIVLPNSLLKNLAK
ncbi:MAG: hypothetical protein ACRBDX_04375 [Gammaproteobacteria bacterium]